MSVVKKGRRRTRRSGWLDRVQIVNLVLALALVAILWRLTVWVLERSLAEPRVEARAEARSVQPREKFALANRRAEHVHLI